MGWLVKTTGSPVILARSAGIQLMLVFVSLVKLTYKYYFITKLLVIFSRRLVIQFIENFGSWSISWIPKVFSPCGVAGLSSHQTSFTPFCTMRSRRTVKPPNFIYPLLHHAELPDCQATKLHLPPFSPCGVAGLSSHQIVFTPNNYIQGFQKYCYQRLFQQISNNVPEQLL